MKSYIKKRKHRNGVRPTRKGALKVRMVEFPDNWTQLDTCSSVVSYATRAAIDLVDTPYDEVQQRNDRTNYLSHCNRVAKLFQRGYTFIMGQKQISPIDLAMNAINEVNPVFVGKSKSVCDTCEHKSNCPFSAFPKHLLVYACPIHWEVHCNRIMKAIRDEPTDTPLMQPDMAKLALIHLS